MTVSQLIRLLEHMPQDVPVVDICGMEVEGAHEDGGFIMGDGANPHNPTVTVVQLE